MTNREQRRSPLVTKMLANIGIEEDAIEAAWPQVLTACTTVLQKARMQGVVNNGHLMAFAGSMIVETLENAPEADRGRIFDEYVANLRKEIVSG